MPNQNQPLLDTIIDRLAEADLGEHVEDLVLAAVQGDVEFEQARGSGQRYAKPAPVGESREPAGAYLTGISVEGFRGIGPKVTLNLSAGPGLTVVTGRNGSGKSTFAEALEIALTGQNRRWSGRTQEWSDGWRNLHHGDRCEVVVGLALSDDDALKARVHRTWLAGATSVDEATVELRRPNRDNVDLAELGWTGALENFRPLLSHNELGEAFTGAPSALFDTLSSILGLGDLTDGVNRLKKAAADEERRLREVRSQARGLRGNLAQVDDPRAKAVSKALQGLKWDLDDIEAISGHTGGGIDPELGRMTALSTLQAPQVTKLMAATTRLREALEAAAALGDSPDAELSILLETALQWHGDKESDPCPVCGTGTLDSAWVEAARSQVNRLTDATNSMRQALTELRSAEGSIRALVPPVPSPLEGSQLPSSKKLAAAWKELVALPAVDDGMADHVDAWASEVEELTEVLRREARDALEEREATWRPHALEIDAWVREARDVHASAGLRAALSAAKTWLVAEEDSIRNARLAPLAAKASETWQQLRQESNVELAGMSLVGANTRRKVDLDVRVDGSETSALAVMSQGELNALSLSIFLPRATLPESPFRFLVIDDPVQAMDPSKVDGLARVLHAAANTRQVIVFTHDDRLPQSLRRLRLEATVLEVRRGPDSVVDVRRVSNPVTRQWLDALALLKDDAVSDSVLRRVVPGILRASLEAACQQKVRRTRLSRPGQSREDVEQLLTANPKLYPLMALAVFDDQSRTGDLLSWLNNRFGRWAGDLIGVLNRGAHGASQLDRPGLDKLANSTRNLIEGLGEWDK